MGGTRSLKRQLTVLQKDMAQASLTADVRHLETPLWVKAERGLEKNLRKVQTHTIRGKREDKLKEETLGK